LDSLNQLYYRWRARIILTLDTVERMHLGLFSGNAEYTSKERAITYSKPPISVFEIAYNGRLKKADNLRMINLLRLGICRYRQAGLPLFNF
jgi:hypothetical protein